MFGVLLARLGPFVGRRAVGTALFHRLRRAVRLCSAEIVISSLRTSGRGGILDRPRALIAYRWSGSAVGTFTGLRCCGNSQKSTGNKTERGAPWLHKCLRRAARCWYVDRRSRSGSVGARLKPGAQPKDVIAYRERRNAVGTRRLTRAVVAYRGHETATGNCLLIGAGIAYHLALERGGNGAVA